MDAMLASMDGHQLTEWFEFFRLEPWGAEVEDHRAGVIAAMAANMAGQKLRPGHEVAPSDLFPSRLPKPTRQTFDEQVRALFGSPEDW